MSTLTSANTLAEIIASYTDNASYREDNSASKASAFATACRILLLKFPKRTAHGGRGGDETEIDPVLIEKQLADAEQFANFSGQAKARRAQFTNFRD